MGRRIFALFLLLLLVGSHLHAQDGRPMLRITSLRQNDFTFFNNLDLDYQYRKGKYGFDLKGHHDNIYNTSLDADRFVQLYFKSTLRQYYQWKKNLAWTALIETDNYVNTDNNKASFYGGAIYKPKPFVEITPMAGVSIDRRKGVVDVGFSPALAMRSQYEFDNDLSVDFGGYARVKFINPRVQRNFTAYNYWTKEFAQNTRIMVGIRGGSHELDDYQGTTGADGRFTPSEVKRIISDSLNPMLKMEYEFAPGVAWRSENEFLLFRRFFKFNPLTDPLPSDNDLDFSGLELLSRQQLSWVGETFRFSGYYEFMYSTRGYQLTNTTDMTEPVFDQAAEREKQKDFKKTQHKTDAKLLLNVSKRQILDFTLTNIYLQYDTPSEENYDDRDELSYIGSVTWNSKWRRNFTTSLGISGNYRHYAFLFAEKSQDNYKQRSLRMDFAYAWDVLRNLRIEGRNAVYVTYNVKDFSDFNKTDRSTRNLETNLKAVYRPLKSVESRFSLYRKETHQSYLNWVNFSETTLDTIRILTAEQTNRYELPLKSKEVKLYAEAGYKHFSQVKKFKTSMLNFANEFQPIVLHQVNWQTGPILGFGYRDRRQSSIEATLWLQFQTRKNRWYEEDELGALGTSYSQAELEAVEQEVKPYFTLNFNYFFK